MTESETFLDSLASAALDAVDVDWDAAESRAPLQLQPVVKELRLLALVATVHRTAPRHESSTASWTSAFTARPLTDDAPETWGHLKVLDLIGRGACGAVYRAWDGRLDREVALKLLPAPAASEEGATTAIINEGRLLARVRHPNVVTVHGADRIGPLVGLWMELVRGRTLEDQLRAGGPFAVADAVEVGVQVAAAVAAVHAAGLLHRDIKATNVVRADDRRVVLMDFGAGRDADDRSSSDLTGTPLYLAPEVLRGQPATPQSDIYSLGVLLYHLLTGGYPVYGRSLDEIRAAHARGERADLRAERPDVPAAIARIIERALHVDPGDRFASATALVDALRARDGGTGASRRQVLTLAAAAIAAVAGLTWAIGWRSARPSPGATSATWPRIAVLPFVDLSPAPAVEGLATGLAHELQRSLTRLDGLVPIAFASSSRFPPGNRQLQDVASQLRADLLLDGSLERRHQTLRIQARLTRMPDQTVLWSAAFDRDEAEVFSILDDISAALIENLRVRMRMARRHETSPELFFLVWQARSFQHRRGEADALAAARLFEQVVDRDASYAPAWAGLANSLADAYRLRGGDGDEPMDDRIRTSALRAIQLDELLPDAHQAMGNLLADQRDWPRAEAAFRRAIDLSPSLTGAHTDLALAVLMPLARNDVAIRLLEEAVTRDPASLDLRRVLAHFYVNGGRYHEAIETSRWVLERDATFPFASLWLARALTLSGRPEEAIPLLSARDVWGYLGYAYAVVGRTADAQALAAAHPEDARGLMLVYSGLRDAPRALDALERLAATNPWRAATWLHRPEMAVLRGEPRFEAVKARLSLTHSSR